MRIALIDERPNAPRRHLGVQDIPDEHIEQLIFELIDRSRNANTRRVVKLMRYAASQRAKDLRENGKCEVPGKFKLYDTAKSSEDQQTA